MLTYIFENELSVEVRQIENRQFRLDSEGATFEGRDVFAPSAAWLTRGQTPGAYGRLVSDYEKLKIEKPEVRGGSLHGRVAYIDHFGNIITDITPTDIQAFQQVSKQKSISFEIGGVVIDTLKTHYEQGSSTKPDALINSNGYLEVFMKEGSAAETLGVKTGTLSKYNKHVSTQVAVRMWPVNRRHETRPDRTHLGLFHCGCPTLV